MKTLRICAVLTIVLHLLGLLAAVFWIKPGMLGLDNDAAMSHIETSVGWRLGWGVWALAALAFVAFMAALERFCGANSTLSRLAMMVGVAAAAIDCLFDLIHITVSPELMNLEFRPSGRVMFYAFERLASSGGIILANGLYSIAVVLMTEALRDKLTPLVRVLGWVVLITGLALSATDFSSNHRMPEYFAGPAIGSYMLWVFAATWSLTRR